MRLLSLAGTLNKTSTINASNVNNERQYVNEFITPGGIASATAERPT